MSTMYVNNIAPLEGNTINVASGTTLNASSGFTPPAGHVIQVVSNIIRAGVSFTSTSYISMGLSVSITPKLATSTLYVKCTSTGSDNAGNATIGFIFRRSDGVYSPLNSDHGHGNTNSPDGATIGIYLGNTGVGNNRQVPFTMEWFDDTHNTTDEITYTVYGANNSGSAITGMGALDGGTVYDSVSTISIMEIAG